MSNSLETKNFKIGHLVKLRGNYGEAGVLRVNGFATHTLNRSIGLDPVVITMVNCIHLNMGEISTIDINVHLLEMCTDQDLMKRVS